MESVLKEFIKMEGPFSLNEQMLMQIQETIADQISVVILEIKLSKKDPTVEVDLDKMLEALFKINRYIREIGKFVEKNWRGLVCCSW